MEPAPVPPTPLMMVPFVVLLATIALAPLVASNWWLKHYPKVALSLGSNHVDLLPVRSARV